MLNKQEKVLSEILSLIADEINITPTMQMKAVASYEAVGKWIGEGIDFDVEIMPQGSMNLGTVIRPVDDSDDGYDMDLVCLLKNGQSLNAENIKWIVGRRLLEHKLYSEKLDAEGKRCWTMNYDGFHMDILPCVPVGIFLKPYSTAIRLTHKNENGIYENRYSNPYQYLLWFENCMKETLGKAKQEYVVKNEVEIDKVPTYIVRTPLQQAIQLLKRHRDVYFKDSDDNAPISIIITTLAAISYNGEKDLYESLLNILEKMPSHIEVRGGEYWIPNPVMDEENFADKWNEKPIKREVFYEWLTAARSDLLKKPLSCFGLDSVGRHYKAVLGEAPVNRGLNKYAQNITTEREKGNLYIDGLKGGLTTNSSSGTKSVKQHMFYGR